MDMESGRVSLGTHTLGSGDIRRLRDMASITGRMEIDMKVNGSNV